MKTQHWVLTVLTIAVLLTGCQSTPAMTSTISEPSSSATSSTAQNSKNKEDIISSSSTKSSSAANTTSVQDCVPESTEKSQSFLNGSVFVGDSVTLKLKNYVTKRRKSDPGFFGTAAFLTAGSMGSGNALKPISQDSIHPYYNGEKSLLEDSAVKIGADKVYLMFGINDVAPYGVDGAAKNLETLAKRFCDKIPNVKIYIQSATPMLADKQQKTLNNPNLERYNKLVSEICKKQGWYFLDVASVMRDSTGALKAEYCSDPDDLGLHFTDTACEVWIHYILTHTGG
ncbi:MAG: GDSL-type esterase/lipase family protein [Oscillospiraceae bacterium]|jgi:lysophospholipase L1-like esterase|nr:GDSL-type esterase/lipase family protein [Oscillospiraceae bacterium]